MVRPVTLSEQSKVTIGLCISILILSFWMGVAWAQIAELEKKIPLLESIDQRLSHIEGALGVEHK